MPCVAVNARSLRWYSCLYRLSMDLWCNIRNANVRIQRRYETSSIKGSIPHALLPN